MLPPAGKSGNARYPIAVTPGARGVLTSDSTRIAGLVSLADVAHGRVEVVEVDDPVATLERLDRRIAWNDDWRLLLSVLAGGVAYLAAVFVPRFGPRVVLLALAANLWLAGWWVVALLGVAAALLPLGAACATVLAAYLLALGLDAETVALSPFGPSQAGRFYGVSNLLETMLLVPALLGPWLLGRVGIAVGALALVTVAGNRFGADGGGLLVLLAGYATLVAYAYRARLRPVHVALAAAGVVMLGVALVGLDAALGGSSHVTEALGDGPAAVLGDVADRLEISVRRSFAGVGPAFAVLASLAVLVVVAARSPRRPVTDAVLVALLVSLLVNDTPGDVLGWGAVAAMVVRRYEEATPRASPTALDRLRAMRRPLVVLALLLTALALVAAGCYEGEVTATPETVEGTIPEETTGGGNADLPALELTGDPAAGEEVFASTGCGACHTLSAAGSSGTVGPNLDEAAPSYELAVERVTLGQGGHAHVRRAARATADRGRRGVRRLRRLAPVPPLSVVDGFPQPVQAFACDLDGTLIGRDARYWGIGRSPRSRGRRTPGVPVLVATGRMFRSVEPYLERAGIERAGRLLPGRGRGRPADARVPPARAARARRRARGDRVAAGARALAERLRRRPALRRRGDRVLARLLRLPAPRGHRGRRPPRMARAAPTKLVAVADPERLAEVRLDLEEVFGARLFITTSLPHLLELGHPGASKGSGIAFVAELLRIDLAHVVAFGDGENDVELLAVAGLGIAIEDAHPRLRAIADRTCPGPAEEGVAAVIEAVLDSRG